MERVRPGIWRDAREAALGSVLNRYRECRFRLTPEVGSQPFMECRWKIRSGDVCPGGGGAAVAGDYSGLVSEVPEKAATIAGAITIPTKVRPIRRSCMGVILLVGFGLADPELIHTMIMTQVTVSENPTSTVFRIRTVSEALTPRC